MKRIILSVLVVILAVITTQVVQADSPWCCGALGAKCATEKEQRDWARIYGTDGPAQWRGHNCGAPNTVYSVEQTPQPSVLQKLKSMSVSNIDLSNRDKLKEMSDGVTKITSQPAAQTAASQAQKVIRKVNNVYQQNSNNKCSCSAWDKFLKVKRIGCPKCS